MVRNKASTSSGSPNVASSIKNCFKASPNGQTLKSPPRSPTHGSTNNFANFSPPRSEPKPFKSLFKTNSVLNQVKTEKTMSSVTEKARNPPNGFVKQSEKQKINGDCKVEVKKFQNGVIDFKKLKQSPKKEAEMNGEQHLTSRIQAQPASYRKLCGVFKEGHDVLVRWSDGLYYLGTVFKVDDFAHRCYVQFEDKSMFWAQFKDLQMINNKDGSDNGVDSDVTCSICHDGVSDPPNEIVLCDKCGQGYHQVCHIPAIDTSILNDEETPWQCRTCVFAAVAKRGGAESDGPAAATLRVYKQVLPYDLKSLTWDKGHKVNHEELYCYCGGPGDWYLKMLQCCRCQQWFHEACMQCLETPFLYGDRFFLFICSICNHGSEYVKRLPMRWVDVVHLVLYNITIAKLVKYYDFQSTMMPFFVQNWEELQLGDLVLEASTRSQLKERVLETLQNNKSRFQCGSESKKAKMSWGLRTRSPPVPPTLNVPLIGEINDELLASLDLRHGSALLNDSPTPMKRSGPGDVEGDSPSVKRRLGTIDLDWSPSKTADKYSPDNARHCVRENLFGSEKQPKRRRGRPRKEPKGRGRSSASTSTTTESVGIVQKPFNHDTQTIIPVHEMFQDTTPSMLTNLPRHETCDADLRRTIAQYFGPEGRIACGERYRVLAKRVVTKAGNPPRTEYLLEWEGYTAKQLQDSVRR